MSIPPELKKPMIYSTKHKFVFVQLHKNVSESVMRLLIRQYDATPVATEEFRFGPKHLRTVPSNLRHLFTFATVRNPYSRLVSLWHFSRTRSLELFANYVHNEQLSFPDFVRWHCTDESPKLDKLPNQSTYLADVDLDAALKCENLPWCLRSLPFWVAGDEAFLGHGHKGRYAKPWREYYGDDLALAKLAEKWAGDDFEQYGYDRDSWKA
jgi:hypothetical protein